jgi:hypothetical protein
MPSSVSDFCSQVNAATPSSGARFVTSVNRDGSVAIYRKATAATATLTLLFPRVVFGAHTDSVNIGSGAGLTAQNAPAFISSLS